MKITYIYTHADVNVKHMYDLPHGLILIFLETRLGMWRLKKKNLPLSFLLKTDSLKSLKS